MVLVWSGYGLFLVTGPDFHTLTEATEFKPNQVFVTDESYLIKDKKHTKKFNLNKEQEIAFHIVANQPPTHSLRRG